MKHWVRTGFTALSLSALLTLPIAAQAQQRTEMPGGVTRVGPSGGGRNFTPSPGARIEPRIRSGAAERRGEPFRGPRVASQYSAPPLTVTRSDRRGERWVYTGRTYDRGRYYDGGRNWFPGLIAAPFLLPWYLLGGGGYNDPYYDPYETGYYGPGYEEAPYAYPGPSTTFSSPMGQYCATPQKVCLLYEPAEVGLGCSCRAPAGYARFRGSVVP